MSDTLTLAERLAIQDAVACGKARRVSPGATSEVIRWNDKTKRLAYADPKVAERLAGRGRPMVAPRRPTPAPAPAPITAMKEPPASVASDWTATRKAQLVAPETKARILSMQARGKAAEHISMCVGWPVDVVQAVIAQAML